MDIALSCLSCLSQSRMFLELGTSLLYERLGMSTIRYSEGPR